MNLLHKGRYGINFKGWKLVTKSKGFYVIFNCSSERYHYAERGKMAFGIRAIKMSIKYRTNRL